MAEDECFKNIAWTGVFMFKEKVFWVDEGSCWLERVAAPGRKVEFRLQNMEKIEIAMERAWIDWKDSWIRYELYQYQWGPGKMEEMGESDC